jgi:hypothetical protein
MTKTFERHIRVRQPGDTSRSYLPGMVWYVTTRCYEQLCKEGRIHREVLRSGPLWGDAEWCAFTESEANKKCI